MPGGSMVALTKNNAATSRARPGSLRFDKGVVVAFLTLVLSLLVLHGLKPRGLSYFDASSLAASGASLALAALGQTIVIVSGGLDLSAGATISLVNVVLVRILGSLDLGPALYAPAALTLALATGAGVGALNGLFVGYLRLQPVVVTLAMMFMVQGAALLIMPTPGGEFADAAAMLFVGDAIPGYLPASIVILLLAMAVWIFLAKTRLGVSIKAIGSDADSAYAHGIDVRRVRFLSYTLAGAAYGWAGLAVAANTGSADPLIGAPMLLKIFAAVVLGGVVIGGGRGNALGAIFGSLTLTTVTTVLLLSGIQTYYVPIVEGVILLVAVLLLSAGRDSPAIAGLRRWRAGGAPRPTRRSRGLFPTPDVASTAGEAASTGGGWRGSVPLLRLLLPPYVLFVVVLVITAGLYGSGFSPAQFLATLLVFTTFLAILGLGQGAVVISGGLDLSIAWAITLPAVVLTAFANGSDSASVWAIPLALAVGVAIGLINGSLIVGFALSPIIVTLAVGGAIEGATLVLSNGAPTGYAPPALAHFVNGRWLGMPSIVWFLLAFVVLATVLLNRSVYGRHLVAVGSSPWAARLSGVDTGRVTIAAYALSGFCAALVGVLLVGFNSQANYDMGKPYLLASIAAVVLGGTDIRGGRGHYIAIFGGALLFTALSSMLSATSLPEALRSVIYGVVLLAAVLAARDR